MAQDETTPTSVVPVRIEEEMRSSYMDYAMSVIIGRALPDVRDGLKPVHRRILFGMYEQSNTWNRPYKKSARIVGDVMGKYHPHGDSAIYDALVRMAQPFSMRAPLIDGQGNFGSVDGDPAAAMRYTEVRMTRITGEVLADIDKETVDFVPNYDGQESEPSVMPTRIPNLLINGSEGIAVGMATRIPPHNIAEVIGATLHLIDHPDATTADLMRHVPGPDFPTAGFIWGMEGIRQAYETGRGVIRIRARANIEENERSGKASIIVTELPYQVNKARLLEKIAELVREKVVEGITDLRDESDRRGMRMVIELRRDVNPQVMLNQLYKRTAMEQSFGINMLAIVAGQPLVLGLRDVLVNFLDFRRDVVTRRSLYELRKAEERMHILRGLKKALDQIDAVIRTIRASQDAESARNGLKALLDIDDVQAQAILDMRLQRLTGLEIHKLEEEISALQAEIDRLRLILGDERELLRVIRNELVEILDAYRDPRRTEIVPDEGEISMEDLVANDAEVITLSSSGYIKRTPLVEYRTQRRGGKGLKGVDMKNEDIVDDVFVATTHARLLVFTTRGRCYPLRVWDLPSGGRATRGRPIVNLIPVEPDEKVRAVLPFEAFAEGWSIVTATREGILKKTPLIAYQNIHAGGIIGVNIPEGDELIAARLCAPGDHVLLVSSAGQAVRFAENRVRPMGRATMGVRGIRFRAGDSLVAMVIIPRAEFGGELPSAEDLSDEAEADVAEPETDDAAETAGDDDSVYTVLTITERGYGKRTRISQYPVRNRGGLGVIDIKTSERNGRVAGCRLVADTDEILLATNAGKVIRTRVSDISTVGRNTMGVRIIHLQAAEHVVQFAAFERDDDDDLPTALATDEVAGEASGEAESAPTEGEETP